MQLTSYKFYWGGIADCKVLASNLALNISTRKCFEIPNKTYMCRYPISKHPINQPIISQIWQGDF